MVVDLTNIENAVYTTAAEFKKRHKLEGAILSFKLQSENTKVESTRNGVEEVAPKNMGYSKTQKKNKEEHIKW